MIDFNAVDLSLVGIAGVLVPIAVAFITGVNTSSRVKGLLALFLSALVGVAFVADSGSFVSVNADNVWDVIKAILANTTLVVVASQAAYNMFIKPTGLAEYVQLNIGLNTFHEESE